MSTVVIAVGGNAVLTEGERGTHEQQLANMAGLATVLSDLVRDGHRVVLTHGNGPQVGNLAIQQEEGAGLVPPQPLFVLGAMTQGQVGHLITAALCGGRDAGKRPVATIVTHTLVDRSDPAFHRPTKPIGPFYPRQEAERLARERHWHVVEDAGRGWRRVVPSPRPLEVLELEAVRTLLKSGQLVVAVGGGGIPVVRRDRAIDGIDAVIDKDHASALLAVGLGAERLVLLTQVPGVYRDFGGDGGRGEPIAELSPERDAALAEELPAGSMRPKVEAAFAFVAQTGGEALITSAEAVRNGEAGTRVRLEPPDEA